MSIKKAWNKFLVWAEYKEAEPIEIEEASEEVPEVLAPPPVREVTHKEAVRMKKGREGKEALINAFYGTLVDREPPSTRKRHLHDGWRDGKSHPFLFEGRTYDVIRKVNGDFDGDETRALFESLMEKLNAMAGE
jgi:hypothetical protein